MPSRILQLTLLAASSASSTYVHIRLRSLLLAVALSFEYNSALENQSCHLGCTPLLSFWCGHSRNPIVARHSRLRSGIQKKKNGSPTSPLGDDKWCGSL